MPWSILFGDREIKDLFSPNQKAERMKKEYLLSLVVLLLCFAGFEAVLQGLNYPKAVRSGWRYRRDCAER